MTSRTVEFGTKAQADAVREKHADLLCQDDDRRLKRVRFSSDAPDELLERLQDEAAVGRSEREGGPGQSPLTEAERSRFDFTDPGVNVPKLRSIKAIAEKEGVEDWSSFVDPTLTVDEHRELMKRAARDERGQNLDAEETADEQLARATGAARSNECDHARGHCKHGDPAACEFLSDHCGYDEAEVEAILSPPEGDGQDLSGETYRSLQSAWTGYKIGVNRAKEYARLINTIKRQNGQEPIPFEELGGRVFGGETPV